MVRSMTAYGKAEEAFVYGNYSIEIKSINRKHLDVTVVLPRELQMFEMELRKQISQVIYRGRVSLVVTARYKEGVMNRIYPNLELVRQLKEAWTTIFDELGYEGKVHPSLIAENHDIMQTKEGLKDDIYKTALEGALDRALDDLLSSKEREGQILKEDFEKRIKILNDSMMKIEELSLGSVDEYREKLKAILDETLPFSVGNDERILRELVIYSDKVDIAEEITRFHGALSEFKLRLNSDQDVLGKTLDFVLQELSREINTIASKSVNMEITKLVVDIKTEIERIREQVQNVE